MVLGILGRVRSLALGALALLLMADVVFAQEPTVRINRPSVTATGEATITANPDQARIDIGVVTQAQTAEQAAAQNAQKLERVLAAVRAAAGAGAEIKTVSYSLSPVYNYPREGGGEPTIVGYRAANIVRVRLNDLTRVGPVIDAATGAGANEIQGLQFTLQNEAAVRAEALAQAARKARQQAEAIAAALGARLGGVLAAQEGGSPVRPVFAEAAAMRADVASTPVEPGTVEVRATVQATFEVLQ